MDSLISAYLPIKKNAKYTLLKEKYEVSLVVSYLKYFLLLYKLYHNLI